jgi:LacI family transcriptional regulator
MMRTKRRPVRPRWVEPTRVSARGSTDVLAVADPLVAEAVRWIHEHATQAVAVEDLVGALPTNRRTLEMRFAAVLGISPRQQITRVRIERAKRLLHETDLPITAIADRMGYASFNYFSTVFRRETGMTLRDYRRGCRAGA